MSENELQWIDGSVVPPVDDLYARSMIYLNQEFNRVVYRENKGWISPITLTPSSVRGYISFKTLQDSISPAATVIKDHPVHGECLVQESAYSGKCLYVSSRSNPELKGSYFLGYFNSEQEAISAHNAHVDWLKV